MSGTNRHDEARRHELKILPEFFEAVLNGSKRFEFRQEDDKTFAVGDVLVLREWREPAVRGLTRDGGYSGRRTEVEVTYVLRGMGVPEGWAVLSIANHEADAQHDSEASEAAVTAYMIGAHMANAANRASERTEAVGACDEGCPPVWPECHGYGHSWCRQTAAPYGYCPKCGAPGVNRERRVDGNDRCANEHVYPSKSSLNAPPPRAAEQPTPELVALVDAVQAIRSEYRDRHVLMPVAPANAYKALTAFLATPQGQRVVAAMGGDVPDEWHH